MNAISTPSDKMSCGHWGVYIGAAIAVHRTLPGGTGLEEKKDELKRKLKKP